MLQTLKHEAKRLQIPMPAPERLIKVQKSMAMIKVVIAEREKAVRTLEEIGYNPVPQEEIAVDQQGSVSNKLNADEQQLNTQINLNTTAKNIDTTSTSASSNTEHAKLSIT